MTDYFDWLLQRIGCQGDGYRATYLIMNDIPFRYFVMDDENRMEDGLRLRDEYMYENNLDETVAMPVWPFDRHRASVFEVLVGIVLRMDDQGFDMRRDSWMHMFLENLGINEHNKQDVGFVRNAVNRFVERRYDPDGYGGLFQCLSGADMSRLSIFDQMVEFGNHTSIPNRWDD